MGSFTMKAYAITKRTKKTGEILEIEGQVHESNDEVFMVKRDAELNQYYRTQMDGDVFPSGEPGQIDGYWFKSREEAIAASKRMIQNEIKFHSNEIKILRGVRFQ